MSKSKFKIVIVGAGGIGRAAALLLREVADFESDIFIGDLYKDIVEEVSTWVNEDSKRGGTIEPFIMAKNSVSRNFASILKQADIILDCLPGSQAPRIATLARENQLHYVNLTEYVKEINEVMQIAKDAQKGFILQTGLAPGFINVLAIGLFQKFCKYYEVNKVEYVSMKVGALTQTAYPPHFYGFTWSPVGVATLYVKPAKIIRDYKTTMKASLTERSKIILHGIEYEEDLTSGGAADLPESLAGRTRNLDYKTLRYPGHYDWIESLLKQIPYGEDQVEVLQKKMEELVPMVENDLVVIYASVSGYDKNIKLRIMEEFFLIRPIEINGKILRAIQATTAAGLVESARLLFSNKYKGCILQSQIDSEDFLNGPFIDFVYRSVV